VARVVQHRNINIASWSRSGNHFGPNSTRLPTYESRRIHTYLSNCRQTDEPTFSVESVTCVDEVTTPAVVHRNVRRRGYYAGSWLTITCYSDEPINAFFFWCKSTNRNTKYPIAHVRSN